MTSLLDQYISARDWTTTLGGEPRRPSAQYDLEDPATGRFLASAPEVTPDEVDAAVQAAAAAQREWAAHPPRERAQSLRELASVLTHHREELAVLDAIDGGFPLDSMRADVDAAVDQILLFADMALDLGGRTIPVSNNLHFTTQSPFGVVGRVNAYNHPFMFAASKAAAPLLAGNAVVIKAPEQAPLSTLRFAELASTVLPTDLVIAISGRGSTTGRALVRHPAVRRIGFTGSPPTGRTIQRDAAEIGVKSVSLELGGKNAQIVMADADLEEACQAAVFGMNFTWTAGQSCGSTSRLLLHESIAEQVSERVADLVRAIRVGHPLDADADMGPLISRAQYDKTMSAIQTAVTNGSRVVAGGGRPSSVGDEGWYVAPTVLTNVDPSSPAAQEEIFGPVLSVLTFRTETEAVAIANGVDYGLTSSIWTNDLNTAHRLSAAVEAGYVLVNSPSRHFWGLPFGGVKSSGVGREESSEELVSYTETKSTTIVIR